LQGFSENYREVIREDKVKVDGQTKSPDYSFRIGDKVKFYVEAKKPSVNIKENAESAFQLKRYAWTQGFPPINTDQF
jgi:ribosomal 50S subunit-recycling heat shock protein